MISISLDELETVLARNGIKTDQVVKILNEAKQIVEENREDKKKEAGPKLKFEYSIVLSDPEKKIPTGEYVGWIVKFREGKSMKDLPATLHRVAADYNSNSRQGRKNPLQTFGELFQFCKAKFFKPAELKPVTKEPVFVHVVDNQLRFGDVPDSIE